MNLAASWYRILAITAKELRQLGRDRLTVALAVAMPLIQILVFGYSINFNLRHLGAAVADLANTSGSRALVADLQATQVINVTERLASPADLEAALRAGRIAIGLYIPPDFERRRLDGDRPAAQVLVDGSEPIIEGAMRGLTGVPIVLRPGISTASPRLFEIRTLYNPEKRTPVQIVPAITGVILHLTMVVFTAIALVRERERGNLELLITTPVRPGELMFGKLLPYVLVGLVQTTVILAAGAVMFDVPMIGRFVDLYAASLVFIAATLALGLVISTVTQTQFQAMQLGALTLMPSILLSGFMFPFDGMPVEAQWLARLVPLTHYTDIVRGIVLRGAALSEMPRQLLALVGFFVVLMAIAITRFRKRLD